MKQFILAILACYYKTCRKIKDYQNRYYIKIIQFISIRMRSKRDIRKKYKLNNNEKKSINNFYKTFYGRKVTNKWHAYFAGINHTFASEYIPMSLYFSDIEYFMNPYRDYVRVFADKSIISHIARSVGIKTPRSIFTFTNGVYYDENYEKISFEKVIEYLSNAGEIFIKPSKDSCGGRGCCNCDIHNGIDTFSKKHIKNILEESGKQFLVQNVIKNHDSIQKIYSKSLNTFRIVTYQWGNSILNAPVVMRLGRNGSRVDNASAGGIYIGVDADGQLHKSAFSDSGESIYVHPDTNIVFADYKIISIQVAINAAKRMHNVLSKLGIVNWDFTIDELGNPVLIEANTCGGGIDMVQVAHATSLFGEQTSQVLRWVNFMKSLPVDKREPYYFGRNMDTI